MGEQSNDPRRGPTGGGARRADERGRVTPFPSRRGGPARLPRSASAPPPATRPSGVGMDLRAGRTSLPPIPSRSQRAEPPTKSNPAVIYAPGAATAPPPATGSQLASGSRPHRRSRRIALVALVCAQVLVTAAAVWALTTSRFQTRWVEVAGTNDPLVVHAIQALPLTGCNVFRCDSTKLAHQVEGLPAVANATVSTVYPDGLLVRVTPRQPMVLWETSATKLVIASDGTVLGAVSDDPTYAHLALPSIEDAPAAAFSDTTATAGMRIDALLVNMAAQLRKGMQPVLGAGWTLDYDARAGLVAVNRGGNGSEVIFGTPRDAAQATDDTPSVATLLNPPTQRQVTQGVGMQFAELHALLALLAGQGQQAALIDLRWGAHPYYRLAP